MSEYNNDLSLMYKGDYYIHRHQKNIGRMISEYENNETGMPVDKMVNIFTGLKNHANTAIKNQYKTLYSYNVVGKDSEVLLNEVFKNNNFDQLDSEIKQMLAQRIDSEKIANLVRIQNSINWNLNEIDKALRDTTKDLSSIDSLLTALVDAVTLINKSGYILAGTINKARESGQISISQFGKNFSQALKQFELENKIPQTIEGKQIQDTLNELNKISARFQYGTKGGTIKEQSDPDKWITGQFLKDYIDRHFFSTVLAEGLALGIAESATNSVGMTIKNSIDSIKSTGGSLVSFEYTNTSGFYNKDKTEVAKQGKADVKLKNVQVDLGYIFDNMQGTMTLNIGLSNKSYKTLNFGGGTGNSSEITGGSMPLTRVFNLLTTQSKYHYIGYNILAWTASTAPTSKELTKDAKDLGDALDALQDALFTRSVVYMFGARGKADFANYLLVNGQLISLWEVLQYATNTTLKSRSRGNAFDGLIYSIEGHKNFGKYINRVNPDIRIPETNALIDQSKISAHLNAKFFLTK